jgi:hypothetical protein
MQGHVQLPTLPADGTPGHTQLVRTHCAHCFAGQRQPRVDVREPNEEPKLCRAATATTTPAIGRLITKISRHDTAATSQPPMNGPTAVPTPLDPDQAPMALPRSPGRRTASRMARLPGVRRAAPTPCNARVPIRNPEVGAMALSTDDSANQVTPVTNTRLSPNLSPSAPATSSRPAQRQGVGRDDRLERG